MTRLQEAVGSYGLSLYQFLKEDGPDDPRVDRRHQRAGGAKGATIGLVTTDGFRDLLEMREGLIEDRYNLRLQPVEPLAARYLRVGIPERIRANGKVERPLYESALIKSLEYLVSEGAESLAV